MPDTSTVARLRAFVSSFHLSSWTVLVSGRSGNNAFVTNARLPERLAGIWESFFVSLWVVKVTVSG